MESFNVLLSLHPHWTELILSGYKPYEFRNKIGKLWAPGTRLFLYETKRGGGTGMVVGKALITHINAIPPHAIGPPRFLLRYWAEYVAPQNAALLSLLDELGDYELPGYRPGTILRYLGRPDMLKEAMQSSAWVRMDSEGTNPVYACEEWLEEIGLIANDGSYTYQAAIRLDRVERFEHPLALSELGIRHPPQGWCYIPYKGGDMG